jgi:hypothetical protein
MMINCLSLKTQDNKLVILMKHPLLEQMGLLFAASNQNLFRKSSRLISAFTQSQISK